MSLSFISLPRGNLDEIGVGSVQQELLAIQNLLHIAPAERCLVWKKLSALTICVNEVLLRSIFAGKLSNAHRFLILAHHYKLPAAKTKSRGIPQASLPFL